MKNYNEIERQRGTVHCMVEAVADVETARRCLNTVRERLFLAHKSGRALTLTENKDVAEYIEGRLITIDGLEKP